MLRKYHETNPRRRHKKNQGDLNLAVQTSQLGIDFIPYSMSKNRKRILCLDNQVKSVPIPCIFCSIQTFPLIFRITEKILCEEFPPCCRIPARFRNSPWINHKIFPDWPFPDTTNVCEAVTNSAINLVYVLYGFLQIFK